MDDEYFRLVMAVTCADDARAVQLFDGAVTRGLRHSPALLRQFALGMIPSIPVTTPGGIIIDERPAFRIEPNRFQTVIESMVRGIYFREVGAPLPTGVPIAGYRTYFPDTPGNRDMVSRMPRRYTSDNGGDFMYFFGSASDEPTYSVLLMVFFRVLTILTGTGATNWLVTEHGAHIV
jgi:hypothetical protein